MNKNSITERVNFKKSITHSPSVKRRLAAVNENYEQLIELKQPSTTKSLINAIHEGVTDLVQDLLTQEVYKGIINELDGLGYAFLHHAARYNRVEVAKILIENGGDLNVRSGEGLTPLHVATRFDAVETLQYFVSENADPSISDSQGNTVLHHAVKRGNITITDILLKRQKVEVDNKNNAEMTSLHLACNLGNEKMVETLISRGADIRAQSGDQMTPLHLAITAVSLGVVKQLVNTAQSRKIPVDQLVNQADLEGNTALHLAVMSADQSIVSFCLQNGANVNAVNKSQRFTPLHMAAGRGNLDVVKLLVTWDADVHAVNTEFRTPLHNAAALGRVDVITYLVEKGANLEAPDTNNRTPLLTAVACGKKQSAVELIKLGADITASDILKRTCLHICIENEQLDVLKMFLDMSDTTTCLHKPDIEDRYPIHYAALTNDFKILETILAKDPMASLQDSHHQTPLHLAAAMGLVKHVQALVKYSAGANKSDDQGRTPLHNAAAGGRRKCCVILIQSGADVNTKDNNRWTPLMLAARNGDHKTCTALLDNQASLSAVTTSRESALSIAITAGNPECLTLFLDRGADVTILGDENSKIEIGCAEVAMALVSHERWQEILGIRQNLLSHLIQHFPDAAKVVLDKCIHRQGLSTDPEYTITYDFRFLNPGPDSQQAATGKPAFAPSVMVEYEREELLLHPLTKKLVDLKWYTSGRYIYYFFFAWYLFFLITYSVFVITERETKKFRPNRRVNNRSIKRSGLREVYGVTPVTSNLVFMYLALAFVIFHMVKELIQMCVQRWRYFTDFSNLTEWALYVTTLMFMLPFLMTRKMLDELDANDLMRPETLWTCGVISIFLAYVNLILFLQRFQIFGLYISMFGEVTRTVLKVLVSFVVFILAFGISFFILFKEQASFRTVGRSLMRTTVMLIGEFDYEATFVSSINSTNNNGASLNPIPNTAFTFLALFLLLMTIVLMNLLVGLAVGDIDAVRRNATLKRLAQMVQFVSDIENKYPRFFLKWFYKPRLRVQPYKMTHLFDLRTKRASQKVRSLEAKLEIADTNEDGELSNVARHVVKNKKRIKTMMEILERQNRLLGNLAKRFGPDINDEEDWEGDNLLQLNEDAQSRYSEETRSHEGSLDIKFI